MLVLIVGNVVFYCLCGCWFYDVFEVEGVVLGGLVGFRDIRLLRGWSFELKRSFSIGVGYSN